MGIIFFFERNTFHILCRTTEWTPTSFQHITHRENEGCGQSSCSEGDELTRHWLQGGGRKLTPHCLRSWITPKRRRAAPVFLRVSSDTNLMPSVKIFKVIVEKCRVMSIFVTSLHVDLGRKVLNVWKLVKSEFWSKLQRQTPKYVLLSESSEILKTRRKKEKQEKPLKTSKIGYFASFLPFFGQKGGEILSYLYFETRFGIVSSRCIFQTTKWKGLENFIVAPIEISKLGS